MNVVYFVEINNNALYGTFVAGSNNGLTQIPSPTTANPVGYGIAVTAIDGSGTLTNDDVPEANNVKIASFSQTGSGATLVRGLITGQTSSNPNVALVTMLQASSDGEGYVLVPLDQVAWDHNQVLTAGYASVVGGQPTPSPADLGRDGSVRLSATIDVDPVWPEGMDLSDYILGSKTWDGGLNVGNDLGGGNLIPNGISFSDATVGNDGDGTYTASVTVNANSTATLGSYRVWWVNSLTRVGTINATGSTTYPYALAR